MKDLIRFIQSPQPGANASAGDLMIILLLAMRIFEPPNIAIHQSRHH